MVSKEKHLIGPVTHVVPSGTVELKELKVKLVKKDWELQFLNLWEDLWKENKLGSFSCGLQFMLVSNTRIAGRFLSCLEKVLCASINSGSCFLTDVRPRPYLAAWNLPQSFTKSKPHWSPETNFGLAQVLTKTELQFQMAGAQDGKDSTPPIPDPASTHPSVDLSL